ncbi:BTAD domain-containing putative transcriptional regulator [Streptomyces sp. SAJ15]|uniref:BTAD domain-containing putative transcriptional regulator n=1 Tax=Streptomyces sp. SAJ15 TaxID=2011095 RepID=UPI00118474E5|nr:BTAD domain-containing putative transcriptional regulator [Streptomyces sp. SAJ15]TVL92655.1 AfsR family transcriptional regulator [Streptomyces sp. SAJ15]
MRYLILGATEARDSHGQPVPLGGARLRALLAALALRAPRPAATPVDVLIDEVWGDDPPHDAPAALQALVGRLRRAIGKEAVRSALGGYRLDATADDIDLFRFERLVDEGGRALDAGDADTAAVTLRAALALWRGPALADLPDREAAAARPEALRLTALHQRVAADLALGRAVEVVPELRELVAGHPLDEPFHAQLIRALRAAGRSADALAAYEDARRSLAHHLGADPGAELQALHQQLLNGIDPAAPPAAAAPAPAALATPPRSAAPGNLRARLTSFIGRQREVRALRTELDGARLVTLTGPGGSGKTRLSEETAATLAGDDYPDGVWAAELAPLDDPRAVPGAVLSAIGRRDTTLLASGLEGRTSGLEGADPTARLIEHCAQRRLLLLLDNCEHVIDAAARLAEALLAHCPGVTVLATSREPLGVPGETVRPVEPLRPAPAHQLFAERAAAVRPGFDPASDPETEAAVAEICRRLDGLPLAIELAAARLRLLTPRQIADRLDDRFRLLTSGSRTVLPRQQTLRAVVDWSWELLDERERTVLRRLSVFAGGCDLPAAEAVCADEDAPGGAFGAAEPAVAPARSMGEPATVDRTGPERLTRAQDPAQDPSPEPVRDPDPGPDPDSDPEAPGVRVRREEILDVLGALVDKSLLVVGYPQGIGGDPGEARYGMLETIHEYVSERAAEHPAARRDRTAAVRRHISHVRAFLHTAEPRLRSAEQLPWLRRVESDMDNIRAALHRALLAPDVDAALAIVFDMGWFWWLRNYRDEGASWVARTSELLAAAGTDEGGADEGEAHFWDRLDLELLRYFLLAEQRVEHELRSEKALAGAERIRKAYGGNPGPRAARFPGLMWPFAAFLVHGLRGVAPLIDTAVANCRVHGGDWALGVLLMFRTHIAIDLPGGVTRAKNDWGELRELSRLVGDRWILAQVEGANGEMATAYGRYAEARGSYEEALRLARELGAHTETPFLITRLADLACHEGDLEGAVKLLDRSEEEAERYGVRDARAFNRALRALIELLNDNVAAARTLIEQARGVGLQASPPPQFWVLVESLDARITASEGDLRGALSKIRSALRSGLESSSTEVVLASQAETAGYVLASLGKHALAARMLGAADGWRGELPRSGALQRDAAMVERTGRAALGEAAFEALRGDSRGLSVEECIALLRGLEDGERP